MDAATEHDLVQRAQHGDRAATALLCALHDPFCIRRGCLHADRHTALERDDCIQTARLGLLDAIRRFDPDRGAGLLTFAYWVIRSRLNEMGCANHPLVPPQPQLTSAPRRATTFDRDRAFDALAVPAPDEWPWPVDRDDLRAAVDTLREPDRTVLRARLAGDILAVVATKIGRTKARAQQIEDRAAETVAIRLLRLARRELQRTRKTPCPAS